MKYQISQQDAFSRKLSANAQSQHAYKSASSRDQSALTALEHIEYQHQRLTWKLLRHDEISGRRQVYQYRVYEHTCQPSDQLGQASWGFHWQ